VADKLGDPLPRQQGRVTLDPRSHIDPIGTLLIPFIMIFASPGFAIIGWGKPVQISLPNRETKKRDDILITLAGPLSNLSIAFICSLSFGLLNRIVPLGESALLLLYQIISLNAVLFLFNLLPVPPLDGSHILKNMVNMKDETFLKFSKYGFFILIILINIPNFQKWMGFGIEGLNSIFFGIFSLLQS
jgi:Zn-dependent protease